MLEWILRGLRKRRITTRYPARPEPVPEGFRGRVDVTFAAGADGDLVGICPTGALSVDDRGRAALDRARCIVCGDCVRAMPERFAYRSSYETASRSRRQLVVDGQDETEDLDHLRPVLADQAHALRRSIHVRHIDCGSDGAEEWEIQDLWNPYYDVQRLGFFLTNAPRHADVLLVTGPVTQPMRGPLLRTWEVMPEPKVLVAVGTDACGGGLHTPSFELTAGGVDQVLPVDVYVPGSPPSPIAIMHGLLLATGLLTAEAVA
jgi:Ni,Fe-hydrogenase III small subunit/formate hydrogenlyase subunit 6/NADH:ubiquinone oxidoreductase subunit I